MDNCRSSDGEVEGLSEEYVALEVLSMVNIGLSSLAKLPSLPKLRKVGAALPVPSMQTLPVLVFVSVGIQNQMPFIAVCVCVCV